MRGRFLGSLALALVGASGCVRVHVDPLEVKPITLNINVKVDRQLDDFFAFENKYQGVAPTSASTTQSTTQVSDAQDSTDLQGGSR